MGDVILFIGVSRPHLARHLWTLGYGATPPPPFSLFDRKKNEKMCATPRTHRKVFREGLEWVLECGELNGRCYFVYRGV